MPLCEKCYQEADQCNCEYCSPIKPTQSLNSAEYLRKVHHLGAQELYHTFNPSCEAGGFDYQPKLSPPVPQDASGWKASLDYNVCATNSAQSNGLSWTLSPGTNDTIQHALQPSLCLVNQGTASDNRRGSMTWPENNPARSLNGGFIHQTSMTGNNFANSSQHEVGLRGDTLTNLSPTSATTMPTLHERSPRFLQSVPTTSPSFLPFEVPNPAVAAPVFPWSTVDNTGWPTLETCEELMNPPCPSIRDIDSEERMVELYAKKDAAKRQRRKGSRRGREPRAHMVAEVPKAA